LDAENKKMTALETAVERLIESANGDVSMDLLKAAARLTIEEAKAAPAAQRVTAVKSLAAALDAGKAEVSGWLAITAGAIVETGIEPSWLGPRLIEVIPAVIEKATAFGEFAQTRALSLEESQEVEEEAGGEWFGDRFLPADRIEGTANEQPDGADAWAAIPLWFPPTLACLTRDAALRRLGRPVLPAVKRLGEFSSNAHCLAILLSVLDDEPFLVFHPATGLGYRLSVSGVADNFQLHTLLADTLIQPSPSRLLGWLRSSSASLPGAKPDPIAASVARGDGPQQSDAPSEGVWDLYAWTCLLPNGTLPTTVPTEHWIWGEGIPVDIPAFEGFRVVILAAPSYDRTWSTARYFSTLRADLVIEHRMSNTETRQWLERLGRAAVTRGTAI
jgi:hypothetical protein